jgi:hypothetical protein
MLVPRKDFLHQQGPVFLALCVALLAAQAGLAQAATTAQAQSAAGAASSPADADPIAIVPIDANDPGGAATVTGAVAVAGGKAMLAAGGSVTSGARTTDVVLPRRGVLRVCASTTVRLAADTSVPEGETPGLLMAIDHGAVEMSYATTPAAGRNADVLLTPDFRILVAGPGSSDLKVRLGEGGDTCVDNSGVNAPYVVVTSLFDQGLYRVQPGQRVMFEHGSLNNVVDEEQESCGCPPAAKPANNEFPLAQSEGLAHPPAPAPPPKPTATNVAPLVYPTKPQPEATAAVPAVPPAAPAAAQKAPAAAATQTASQTPKVQQKKPGFFRRVGRFFKRVFGAE